MISHMVKITKPNTSDAVWITWETQRRNGSMARAVGAEFFELTSKKSRLRRYLELSLKTLKILKRSKPAVVYYQNPSIVLGLLITVARPFFFRNAKIVGDYHNAGVSPPKNLQAVSRWIAKQSDVVIVTNEALASTIRQWAAQPIVFPDPLPHFDESSTRTPSPAALDEFIFLFICSWAEDEPIANVVNAAIAIKDRMPRAKVHITGRPKWEKYLGQTPQPDNVNLTGFLSEEDFHSALRSADVIIDLTTRDNCMVCGAYEGVAAEKPLILSNNPATCEYFSQGTVFTNNSTESISECLMSSKANYETMRREIKELRYEIEEREKLHLQSLMEKLGQNLFDGDRGDLQCTAKRKSD